MRHTLRLFRYEFRNLIRSRWLPAIALTLMGLTEVLLRFGAEPARVVASMMNIVLIVVPLVSIVLGTAYFYASREFNEMLLAQPLNRSSIFLGKLAGFTAPLVIAIVVGLGLPFLLHGYVGGAYAAKVGMLIVVAILLCCVFSAMAFFAAVRFDDRVKGLGSTLILWFFLAVVWDGLILLFIMMFHSYPYENALLGLILMNPIDLGRILILLNLDISSLMGYTGAMFKQFFGTSTGIWVSLLVMCVYAIVPALLGLRKFQNRDF